MNSVTIIGRLGQDPIKRPYKNDPNKHIVTFSIASNEYGYDSSTQTRVQRTEWFNVLVSNYSVDYCANHLRKGDRILINNGKLKSYTRPETGQKYWNIIVDMHGRIERLYKHHRPTEQQIDSIPDSIEPSFEDDDRKKAGSQEEQIEEYGDDSIF